MASQISSVSIGVADMASVRQLWVDTFGLDIVAHRVGPDEELATLWGIPPKQISEQLLLATPGATSGHLHFVQFTQPAAAVRFNAASTDLGAKNIDVNCTDMPIQVQKLKAAGYTFRSEIGEYEIAGIHVREVQMPVHDSLNVVLIEVLSDGFEVTYSRQGFAGLTSFVVIVPDVTVEAAFYKQLFGLDEVFRHELSGPALEMAAGLPNGTVLDLHLLGEAANLFGRVELIEYKGVSGHNRFVNAVAPATGILTAVFKVADLTTFKAMLAGQGIFPASDTEVELLTGAGRLLEITSPAGLRIQVMQG